MNKIVKIVICLLITVSLFGCSEDEKKNVEATKLQSTLYDLSDYETFNAKNERVRGIELRDALQAMEDKSNFVLFVSAPTCPWCVEALPILHDAAIASDVDIYMVNKYDTSKWNSENEYKEVTAKLKKHLLGSEDSSLQMPSVFVIVDGEVVDEHVGTNMDHNAYERKLTQDEKKELLEKYMDLLSIFKKD